MRNRGAIFSVLAILVILIALLMFRGCSPETNSEGQTGRGYTVG